MLAEELPNTNSSNEFKLEKSIEITSLTFPNRQKFMSIFIESSFNKFINLIKMYMLEAIKSNKSYIQLRTIDFDSNPNVKFLDVRKFLVEKGYTIYELEDITGNRVGLKISWEEVVDDHSFANPIKFDEQTELNRDTFPKCHLLKRFSHQYHFNKILNIVKNRMIDAIHSNQTSVKISKMELNPISNEIFDILKEFLIYEREYIVYDVIDQNNVFVGIRILWDETEPK